VVDELLGEPAGAKGMVVWGHNSHLGDMSATDVQNTGLLNLGRLTREHFGRDQVFILGSAGYEGTVRASREWYQEPLEMVVPPAAPGSVEAMLHAGGWDNPILLFENDEQRHQWSIDLLHRGIGVAYTPEAEMPSYYLTAKIGMRHDALVFWRKTRALRQMSPP
jgi:erythromycin esterase